MDIYADLKREISRRFIYRYDVSRKAQGAFTSHLDIERHTAANAGGFMSLTIGIRAGTLSNTYSLVSPHDYSLGDTITHNILDYPVSFKVDTKATAEGVKGIEYTGRIDSDKLMYRTYHISCKLNEYSYRDASGKHKTVFYATAKAAAEGLAKALGLSLDWNCMNFIPADSAYSRGTYKTLLSNLFGWIGSKLPNHAINVYIEGGALHIIQRGREPGAAINLNELHIGAAPRHEFQKIRTEWGGVGSNYRQKINTDEGPEAKFTGAITFGNSSMVYVDGLLMAEKTDKALTLYSYSEMKGAYYPTKKLILQNSGEDITADFTEYFYDTSRGAAFMTREKTAQKGTYGAAALPVVESPKDTAGALEAALRACNFDDSEVQETTHAPLGGGWYGATVTSKDPDTGETTIINTSISQGAPSAAVSPYTVKKQNDAISMPKAVAELISAAAGLLFGGVVTFDNSFPIQIINGRVGIDTAKKLTRWTDDLNGCTQETVTMSIYGASHVITPRDVLEYNGNRYYLEANELKQDITGISQNLTLVRWYE